MGALVVVAEQHTEVVDGKRLLVGSAIEHELSDIDGTLRVVERIGGEVGIDIAREMGVAPAVGEVQGLECQLSYRTFYMYIMLLGMTDLGGEVGAQVGVVHSKLSAHQRRVVMSVQLNIAVAIALEIHLVDGAVDIHLRTLSFGQRATGVELCGETTQLRVVQQLMQLQVVGGDISGELALGIHRGGERRAAGTRRQPTVGLHRPVLATERSL